MPQHEPGVATVNTSSVQLILCLALGAGLGLAIADAAQAPKLPAAAKAKVDFSGEVKRILDSSCIQCQAGDKRKGGFSINNRDSLLLGGKDGHAVEPGDSANSKLIHLVAAIDRESVMPPKGDRLSAKQV